MSRTSFIVSVFLLVVALTVAELIIRDRGKHTDRGNLSLAMGIDSLWHAPDTSQMPHSTQGDLIRYGRLLIANTSDFFGPQGSIALSGNGMNCQNCHLEAGTKAFGNNFGGVFATYPKFRERRGAVENIFQRINDCFLRSLNAGTLDRSSREMQAIMAYIQWVGKDVAKGKKPAGSGIRQLIFLERPADTLYGKLAYAQNCARCHGAQGEGMLRPASASYLYPPLWGPFSYTTAAGLFRLSRFAGYIKDNMPFGVDFKHAQLSDEDAWDIAAFVNSRPRPAKTFPEDWPMIAQKPYDHPFGPYTDGFSELQHKFGPFKPILKSRQDSSKKKS